MPRLLTAQQTAATNMGRGCMAYGAVSALPGPSLGHLHAGVGDEPAIWALKECCYFETQDEPCDDHAHVVTGRKRDYQRESSRSVERERERRKKPNVGGSFGVACAQAEMFFQRPCKKKALHKVGT